MDPNKRGRSRLIARSRRLAAQALAEIADMSQYEIAQWLGLDRSTVSHHLHEPCDYDAMRMVLDRVSQRIEEEEANAPNVFR